MTAIYIAAGVGVALLLALIVFAVAQVEDWSRDLTTNVAATEDKAADERLRPMESELPPAELAGRVEAAAATLKNWRRETRAEENGGVVLHFVRTTPVLHFQDDIRVRIEPRGAGSRLSAESKSRIGKGDLGQNPRNLRELLTAVRAELP